MKVQMVIVLWIASAVDQVDLPLPSMKPPPDEHLRIQIGMVQFEADVKADDPPAERFSVKTRARIDYGTRHF